MPHTGDSLALVVGTLPGAGLWLLRRRIERGWPLAVPSAAAPLPGPPWPLALVGETSPCFTLLVSTAQGPEGLVPSTPQRGPLSTASRLRVQCPVPLVGKHLESQPVSSPAPAGRTMRRARSSLWCVQGRNSLCTPGSYDGRQMRGPFLSYGTCTRETLEGNEGPTGTGPKAQGKDVQGVLGGLLG